MYAKKRFVDVQMHGGYVLICEHVLFLIDEAIGLNHTKMIVTYTGKQLSYLKVSQVQH